MEFVILNHKEEVYRGETKEVILPGRDGEFSVWDFHQPFLYRLRKGNVIYKLDISNLPKIPKQKIKNKERVFIKDGIAKMEGNTLILLCEM